MAKRQTDVERITAWFGAADPLEVSVLFQVIKGILTSRKIETGNRKAEPKKKATAPSKRTAAKDLEAVKDNSETVYT